MENQINIAHPDFLKEQKGYCDDQYVFVQVLRTEWQIARDLIKVLPQLLINPKFELEGELEKIDSKETTFTFKVPEWPELSDNGKQEIELLNIDTSTDAMFDKGKQVVDEEDNQLQAAILALPTTTIPRNTWDAKLNHISVREKYVKLDDVLNLI